MECKGQWKKWKITSLLRFNRDIVECKGLTVVSVWETDYRFNRDIVECKEVLQSEKRIVMQDLIET